MDGGAGHLADRCPGLSRRIWRGGGCVSRHAPTRLAVILAEFAVGLQLMLITVCVYPVAEIGHSCGNRPCLLVSLLVRHHEGLAPVVQQGGEHGRSVHGPFPCLCSQLSAL